MLPDAAGSFDVTKSAQAPGPVVFIISPQKHVSRDVSWKVQMYIHT